MAPLISLIFVLGDRKLKVISLAFKTTFFGHLRWQNRERLVFGPIMTYYAQKH